MSQSNGCREAIQKFHAEISTQLDNMEAKSIKDVDEYQTAFEKKLKQQVDACKAALSRILSNRESLKSSKEAGDGIQTFVWNLKLTQTLESLETVILDISEEIEEPETSFDPNMKLLPDVTEGLGKVMKGAKFKRSKCISDLDIKSTRIIDVAVPQGTCNPVITGSAFMPTDELVLCDYANNRIKIYDKWLTFKEKLTLEGTPWDVVPINGDDLVITLVFARKLQLVKTLPNLQLNRSISLDVQCWGLAIFGDNVYVSCVSEIRVFDTNLHMKVTFADKPQIERCLYIATSGEGDQFISDDRGNSIKKIRNNIQILKIDHQDLKQPVGLFVDIKNHVVVCCRDSNKILVFDENGSLIKTFSIASEGVRPLSICYRHTDNTMVVTGDSKSPTFAFSMK